MFHFLVWAFPYLDIGNALYVYNRVDVLTDVFMFISYVRTKATKYLCRILQNLRMIASYNENTCYSFR